MQKRRITILEELLKSLNPVPYQDVFHYTLKDLAEIYEKIYKLKVRFGIQWSPSVVNVEGEAKLVQFCLLQPNIYYKPTV